MFLKNLQWGILQYYYSGVTVTRTQEIIIAIMSITHIKTVE